MVCRATQDRRIMEKYSDKMWSTGEQRANHFSILAINSIKMQKDRTLKDELPRSVGAQYTTGDQWRNKSRKNEDGIKAKTTPSYGCAW